MRWLYNCLVEDLATVIDRYLIGKTVGIPQPSYQGITSEILESKGYVGIYSLSDEL
jgi:hypothetical protein